MAVPAPINLRPFCFAPKLSIKSQWSTLEHSRALSARHLRNPNVACSLRGGHVIRIPAYRLLRRLRSGWVVGFMLGLVVRLGATIKTNFSYGYGSPPNSRSHARFMTSIPKRSRESELVYFPLVCFLSFLFRVEYSIDVGSG